MPWDMEEDIIYTVENHVARITLNRPHRMNALSIAMRRRWVALLSEFNADPAVRAGVLAAAGDKAFCVGVDLKELAERNTQGKHRPGSREPGPPLMPSKPLVAAIDGYCLAGGLELALLCDIRVATAGATFGLPEIRRGLLPGHAVNLLPALIPRTQAAYLLLTGESISAQEALAAGLVHKVLATRQEAEVEALRIAVTIARAAPLAVREIKHLLASAMDMEGSYRRTAEAQTRLRATEDAKEGPRAFAEKREPLWQGR